jgi:general secretion pathway protein F
MATFYYRAATAKGEWQQGSREGASEKTVAQELHALGLIPVYVGAAPEKATGASALAWMARPALAERIRFGGGVSQDRLRFTQELATLLQAGVPLDRALNICSTLTVSSAFRAVIADVLRQVKSGRALSDALSTQSQVFSKLYANMVRAGQASGSLPVVFQRLAEFETGAAEWRSHMISSLIYPLLLTVVALSSIGVLLNFVIPRFTEVFDSMGVAVPASTAALLAVGRFLDSYGWIVLLGCIGTAAIASTALRTPQGRDWRDAWLLRLPLVGEMLRKAETARFARTMGTLVAHGVPLVESLRIVKETVSNRVIAGSLDGVIQGVKRGEGVAGPVERAGSFPPLAVHLLRVGEETGRLDAMFERLGTTYENETRVALRRLTALFEPAVILVMGVIVGAIVLSLLMAITSINEIPF